MKRGADMKRDELLHLMKQGQCDGKAPTENTVTASDIAQALGWTDGSVVQALRRAGVRPVVKGDLHYGPAFYSCHDVARVFRVGQAMDEANEPAVPNLAGDLGGGYTPLLRKVPPMPAVETTEDATAGTPDSRVRVARGVFSVFHEQDVFDVLLRKRDDAQAHEEPRWRCVIRWRTGWPTPDMKCYRAEGTGDTPEEAFVDADTVVRSWEKGLDNGAVPDATTDAEGETP